MPIAPRRSARPALPSPSAPLRRMPARPERGPGGRPLDDAAAAVLLCLALGLLGLPSGARAQAPSSPDTPPARAAAQAYDIPPGALAPALRRFASTANVLLTFTESQAAGKTTAGLQGQYTPEAALQALLAGTGLRASPLGNGGYVLRADAAAGTAGEPTAAQDGSYALLEAVTVTGETEDGSAERGYLVDKPSAVGPWEGRSLLDTPYSVNIVPRQQIENLQASSPDEIFDVVPTAQLSWPQAQNDAPYVFLRGFQATTSLRNGLGGAMYGHGTTTEDVERVETLTGLSGFLYGPGNVGGVINYVSKRPTATPYRSVTAGYANDSNFSLSGDFGGPIDAAGRFGYRINLVGEDGRLGVDDFDRRKKFVSAAFDWHITDKLLLQVDGSYRDFHSQRQAYWGVANNAERPSADDIDPSLLWSQPWTFFDVRSKRLGANLRWDAGERTTVRAGYLRREDTRSYAFSTNTIQADGTYTQVNRITAPQKIRGYAYNAFVDQAFDTGPIRHKVTAGYMASSSTRYDYTVSQASNTVRGLPMDEPTHLPEPAWSDYGVGPVWNDNIGKSSSFMIGDDIMLTERWSMLVGVNRSTIEVRDRDSIDSPWETTYRKSAWTPTFSLIYKPRPNATLYATYIESLEEGGIAGDTYQGNPVVNAREVMSPLKSKQVEIGAKVRLGGMSLTAALFEIDKGLQYYDLSTPGAPVYVQDGRQVHRGLELTAAGRLTPRLTLTGGMVFLDPKVTDQKQNTALEGNQPPGTIRRMFKLSGEYRVPGFEALTLTGGISYTGARWADANNTDQLPAYTLVNAGARYVLDRGPYPITFRLSVNNLTDKRYWSNGSFLGASRTVRLSASMKF